MGVQVVGYPPLHRKAVSSPDGFVMLGQLADSREKRTVLEHEKQHFRLAAFYKQDCPPQERRRSEARVDRALIQELCPLPQLRDFLRKGRSVAEIAEELEITEELVTQAFAFYRAMDPDAFTD